MKWKRAILRLAEQEFEAVALEEPPVSDTVAGLVCPDCGQMEANVQSVYDHEVQPAEGEEPEALAVAVCQSCGCVFSPLSESVAKTVIAEVFNRRTRRRKALATATDMERQFQTKQAVFQLLSR